ncbi:peptidase U35 [Sinorhizobium medicae]|nr:peptidase U35 [Sinorhizobium medicae]
MSAVQSRAVDVIDSRLREIKSLSVGISRALRDRPGMARPEPPIGELIRAVTCLLLGHGYQRPSPARIAEDRYPEHADAIIQLMGAPGDWLKQRAAVSPASRTVPGWAAELVQSGALGILPLVAPQSVYAALAARGLRVSFDGIGSVSVPRRADQPNGDGIFVGEGLPIPVRQMSLASSSVKPCTAKLISLFSGELQKRSTPTIEAVVRLGLAEDVSAGIDAVLTGSAAGSAIQPPGLLYGLTPIAATAGGGTAALTGDLGALAGAIPNAADLVYLMGEAERVRALTLAPGLAGVTIISAPSLPAKTVIALDAADFVSGEGDAFSFDVSSEATVVSRDDPGPAVATAPTHSLYQQNWLGVRLIASVGWTMRAPNRVAFVEDVSW